MWAFVDYFRCAVEIYIPLETQSIQSARLSLQSSESTPSPPSPQACVAPPPPLPPTPVQRGGGTHSLGGDNSDEGTDTLVFLGVL
jgi:hypothetical protein